MRKENSRTVNFGLPGRGFLFFVLLSFNLFLNFITSTFLIFFCYSNKYSKLQTSF